MFYSFSPLDQIITAHKLHNMQRLLFLATLCLFGGAWLSAQSALFSLSSENEISPQHQLVAQEMPLENYTYYLLDRNVHRSAFSTMGNVASIELPSPNGEMLTVNLVEKSVFPAGLAARYPNIKSYQARTKFGTGRISVSSRGITALLAGPDGDYFISPLAPEDNSDHHLVYRSSDMKRDLLDQIPHCGWDAGEAEDALMLTIADNEFGPETSGRSTVENEMKSMFVYDLALTCTGEFAQVVGGDDVTVEEVMGAFNDALNVLNGILERETASTFQLVENNDDLIYIDPLDDPFTQPTNGGQLLNDVITAINANNIPLGTLDLGHVFTAGCSGGLGGVVGGVACGNGKTRGVTCFSSSNIAFIVREIMAHEVAHQFAVGHSWNNCPSSQGQLASDSAFEPGSGSTIMSYSGSCGPENNVQGSSDDYYHVGSLDQFQVYSREIVPGCATVIDPVNHQPVIELDYEDGFFIPISTPFELQGTATDEDGDDLLYCWEQYDLGPSRDLGNPILNTPIFRSFPPIPTGHNRIFPRIENVISNSMNVTEVLPTYTRDLTFRMTVRDNNAAAGASVWETVAFHATDEAGPFLVTSPNTNGIELTGGDYVEVTWDVANTDQAPVNCSSVKIRLSTDGGFTFPITLIESTGNVGSAFVTIPPTIETEDARIRIEGNGNVFFDMSNQDFTILAPTEPGFTLDVPGYFNDVCLPTSITAEFTSGGFLGFDETIELDIREDLLPDDITASLSALSLEPGDASTLSVDLSESDYDGILDIVVDVTTAGGISEVRTITLDVVNNDYSDLNLLTPTEGQEGIVLATPFDWDDAQYADNYDIQIATDATFENAVIFDEAAGLTETEFMQNIFYEPNTVYFWRVRGNNECGPGEWRDPRSFRTISVGCNEYEPNDLPQFLPGATAVNTSELFVDASGTISDVNVPLIQMTYEFVNELTIVLESPEGTRVTLYEESCGGFTNLFRSGFDDEGQTDINCPPDDNLVFIPEQSLSAFNGEGTFGTWKLEIRTSSPGGPPGNLTDWSLEFCASIDVDDPFIVFNDDSEVGPSEEVLIPADKLRATDDNFSPNTVTFTVVRKPLHGVLLVDGVPVENGTTFPMQAIYNNWLRYTNVNPDVAEDDFAFVVQNPDGGYIPVNYHRILIDPTLSDVNEAGATAQRFELFPNPVASQLQLRWAVSTKEEQQLQVFDLTGRELQRYTIPTYTSNYQLEVSDLPAGIYFVKVGQHTERIVKQ
ncbi:hypothetical protein CEQ90_07285 [Lewinellaceae bacterium SD302]|nr:hypothetical protein CEQ90_07285 [Lewinellaceae bacterium SD302]